jgi:hypothetical protein
MIHVSLGLGPDLHDSKLWHLFVLACQNTLQKKHHSKNEQR